MNDERDRGRQRRKEKYTKCDKEPKVCEDCGTVHYRVNSTRCQDCAHQRKRDQQLQIKAAKAVLRAGGIPEIKNNNACANCAFLKECRNIVDNSIMKDGELVQPYCFVESIYHHRYLAKYGRAPAGKARAAMAVSA
jgi:hypothetical protein